MLETRYIELINSSFGLTKVQIYFADYFTAYLDNQYGTPCYVFEDLAKENIKENYELELTDTDIKYTLDKLEYDLHAIENTYKRLYKMSSIGHEILQKHKQLSVYLCVDIDRALDSAVNSIDEQKTKKEIDDLTIKSLKGNIFQVKKWWLFLILNALITIGVTIFTAYVIKKMDSSDKVKVVSEK